MPTQQPMPMVQVGRSSNFASASAMVGLAAMQLLPQMPPGTSYLRIINVSPSGGPNLWISRYLGSAVAANSPGALELAPGQYEVFSIPQIVPTNPVWAIADAANCAVTAEFG